MPYAPADAITFAKTMIKSMPIDRDPVVAAQIVDHANKIIWMAAPWAWTVDSITPFTMPTSQDFAQQVPGDFLHLIHPVIWRGDQQRFLTVEGMLPLTNQVGEPNSVAYLNSQGKYRFSHVPAPPAPGAVETFLSMYKKVPPSITTTNFATAGAQVLGDEWFWVLNEGALYFAYRYADDQRAGGAQVQEDGQIVYSGQLATFMAGIETMRAVEELTTVEVADQMPKLGQTLRSSR